MSSDLFCVAGAGLLLFFLIAKIRSVFDFLDTLAGILSPFFYGLVFAYLLCPLYNLCTRTFLKLFEKRKKPVKRALNFSKAISTVISRLLTCCASSRRATLRSPSCSDRPATHSEEDRAIADFFTFRPGQPDYVDGPKRKDQWAWLENYPQKGYVPQKDGTFEQVAVGVAQNTAPETKGHCSAYYLVLLVNMM